MPEIAHLMARISVQGVDQVVRDFNKVDKEFKGLATSGTAMASGFQRIGSGAQQYLGGALVAATAAGTAALVGFGASAVKVASEYESTLNRFSSVAGSAIEDAGMSMSEFNALALDMGAKTQFSAGQAADAMVELAKGGLSPATIAAGGLKGALDLAAAGELGLSQAAGITAKQLGIWGDQGITAADVANQLAQAANASTVDVDELSLGLANVGGSAKVAGLDFREMNQTMALIAPGFSSAADAGTSFKALLSNLSPETARQSDAFRTLNLLTAEGSSKFFDLNGQFIGMEQATRLLAEGTKDLSEEQKIMALNAAFGSDAIRVAALLADQGAEGYRAMGVAMDGAGTAAQQAAERNQGLGFAVESLKGSLETIQIVVGSAVIPILTDFVEDALIPGANNALAFAQAVTSAEDPMRELVSQIDSVLPGFKGTVTVAGAAADVISDNLVPAMYALSAGTTVYAVGSLPKMITAVGVATKALYAQGVAATVALGPLGLLAAGVALAVGGIVKTQRDYAARVDEAVDAQEAQNEVLMEADRILQHLQSTQAGGNEGARANIAELDRLKAAHRELTETMAEGAIVMKNADPSAFAENMQPFIDQQHDLEREIARVTDRMRMQAQAQEYIDKGLKGSTGTWSVYSGGVQDVSKALSAVANDTLTFVELSKDELKQFGKVVEDTVQSIPNSAAAVAGSIVGVYDSLEHITAEHEDALAKLTEEKSQAKTDAAKAAIDDRIAAENDGFARARDQAAIAYAEEQAQLRQHLGESLIARVEAQGALYGVTQEQISNLTGVIASEYGIQQSLSDQTFAAMVGHVDSWAENSNRSALSTIASLRDTEDAALRLKEQEDKLTGEYTATFIHDFEAGRISAEELATKISQIPSMVRSTLETNWQSQLEAIRGVGDAMSKLPASKLIRIEAIIDDDLRRHSPAPIEQVMMAIEDFESRRHVLTVDMGGSALRDDMAGLRETIAAGLTGGYVDMQPLTRSGFFTQTSAIDDWVAGLRDIRDAIANTNRDTRGPSAELQARLDAIADSGENLAERLRMPSVDIQARLDAIADGAENLAERLTMPTEAISSRLQAAVDAIADSADQLATSPRFDAAFAVIDAQIERGTNTIVGGLQDLARQTRRARVQVDDAVYSGSPTYRSPTWSPSDTNKDISYGTPQGGAGPMGPDAQYTAKAAETGRMTAEQFNTTYQEAMLRLQPETIVNLTDWFQDIRRDAVRPALIAFAEQAYFGGQTAMDSLGNGLASGLGYIEETVGSVNGALASIPRDITVNIHANVDPALERHSPSIIEQTLMSIHALAGSVPAVDLRTMGSYGATSIPAPVSTSWSAPEWSMPTPLLAPMAAPAAAAGRSGGDIHLHVHADLRGSNLSLDQVEDRIRRVIDEVDRKRSLWGGLAAEMQARGLTGS